MIGLSDVDPIGGRRVVVLSKRASLLTVLSIAADRQMRCCQIPRNGPAPRYGDCVVGAQSLENWTPRWCRSRSWLA